MTSVPGPHQPDRPGGPVPSEPPETTVEAEIGRVREPARLLRVSTMARSLLDEARGLSLDEHARDQLQLIHTRAVEEIGASVAPELREELQRLLPHPSEDLSQAELRILQSQLVGWLEGVFQGIRVGLTLQQAARPDLPPGVRPHPAPPPGGSGPYL
ncbi:proteasome activator [Nonomuraea candida]|uniref:proteasome activator n=1 Tax=Nonomuraea candida TaxID=359159 RepID=UPI0005BD046F|nr:proteasome activator [Nonomuraea candida]